MANSKAGSRLIKAAGGVAWRPGPDGELEILLVHRRKYDDWSLPKGKAEPGEPLPVTAVREVLEEGGARLALGRRLASVRYNVGGRPKRVHYWAARAVSVDPQAVPNAEVDKVAWLPAARALEKASYPHDHGVLADFAGCPPETVPLILLRHAKALPKDDWEGDDVARPLDDSGRSDAKALADLLTCFAPRPRLISSPAVRCTETVRPLSELIGEPVREVPSLYVHNPAAGTSAADPGPAVMALIRGIIAAGEPAVICAHRENMPALKAAAVAALTAFPAGDVPGDSGDASPGTPVLPADWDDTLPTGGFWVLNLAPLAADQAPGAEPEPGPATGRGPGMAPPRRWWQRLLGRAAGNRPGGEGTDPDAPGAPFPVSALVSADRYDLSESS